MKTLNRFLIWMSGGELREDVYVGGGTIDPDDHLYRSLTSSGGSNLPEWKQSDMLRIVGYLDRSNGVARRILDLIVDFTIGDGIQINADNPDLLELLQDHWEHPVNSWELNAPNIFRLLIRDGELALPAKINEFDGQVTWGQIRSNQIKNVMSDRDDWRTVTSVEFRVPVGEPEDIRDGIVSEWNTKTKSEQLVGEVLFMRHGNVDGVRGISFLYPLADYIDNLDQMTMNELERSQLLRHIIFDVTIKDAKPEQIQRLQKDERYTTPPRPGEVLLHNDAETWESKTPNVNHADAVELLSFLLNTLVLGSAGIPEHWFGSGGDVNRATAQTMDAPTLRMITRMQNLYRYYIQMALRFVVDQAVMHRKIPAMLPVYDSDGKETGEIKSARTMFSVAFPTLDVSDTKESAETFRMVVEAVVVAVDEGYISHEAGMEIICEVASQFGPDLNPDREGVRITNERETIENTPVIHEVVAEAIDVYRAGVAV